MSKETCVTGKKRPTSTSMPEVHQVQVIFKCQQRPTIYQKRPTNTSMPEVLSRMSQDQMTKETYYVSKETYYISKESY